LYRHRDGIPDRQLAGLTRKTAVVGAVGPSFDSVEHRSLALAQ